MNASAIGLDKAKQIFHLFAEPNGFCKPVRNVSATLC
jgi:hypothetical protein